MSEVSHSSAPSFFEAHLYVLYEPVRQEYFSPSSAYVPSDGMYPQRTCLMPHKYHLPLFILPYFVGKNPAYFREVEALKRARYAHQTFLSVYQVFGMRVFFVIFEHSPLPNVQTAQIPRSSNE